MEQNLHMLERAEDFFGFVSPPKINLYDFDGVLASPFEEALFTMPETEHDAEFIRQMSYDFDIDLQYESQQSQRYIALQACMDEMGVWINRGPLFDQIKGPFHILTARADRFAIKRMHLFIGQHRLKPVKILHLDHLPKGLIIDVLLERHPEIHFEFWDDNMRHVESARALNSSRLTVNHVDNDMEPLYTAAESFYRDRILGHIL